MTNDDVREISMATGEWSKTRAYATVKFTNGLTVNGVKVIMGTKGLFVALPSIKRKNKETQADEWKDCCFIEDEEDRKAFQQIVLDAYNNKVSGGSGGASAPSNDGDGDQSSFF